jgi:hypothetical protein
MLNEDEYSKVVLGYVADWAGLAGLPFMFLSNSTVQSNFQPESRVLQGAVHATVQVALYGCSI